MSLATHLRPATETTDTDPTGPIYRERAYFLEDFAARWGGVVIDPAPDLKDRALYQVHPADELPMSWHINRERDLHDLFGHVRRVGPDDPLAAFDGHTTDAKYARMRALHQRLPGAPRPVVGERRLYRDGRGHLWITTHHAPGHLRSLTPEHAPVRYETPAAILNGTGWLISISHAA